MALSTALKRQRGNVDDGHDLEVAFADGPLEDRAQHLQLLGETRLRQRPVPALRRAYDLPMRVIFDVDGTLIHSGAVDAELFERAFLEAFETRLPTTDWAFYRNATDRGIVEEAAERLGLPLNRVQVMRERFVRPLLALTAIEPVAGARSILRELESRGVRVGIATGRWEAAARAKLRAARVELSVPLIGSDDFGPYHRSLSAFAAHFINIPSTSLMNTKRLPERKSPTREVRVGL
jgi:FMN phosphatase YigB (HAD superfamily)